MGLNRRPARQQYRRHGGKRPHERNVLLFLIVLAFGIALLWRSPPPRIPEIAPPTPAKPTIGAGAPTVIPPQATGLARTLGPAIDGLIANYETRGIERVGLVIEDGTPTDTIARDADTPFAAASLYKLFLLWRTQVEIRQGKLRDDTELPLTAENDDADEDGYSLGAYGDTVSVADLRRLMITASNNTAAQVLGLYFGWGTVDQLLSAHGYSATVVAGQARTTPREVTRFLDGLTSRTLDPLLTEDDYTLMLDLLKAQQVNTKLSTGFPEGAVFAHKTGDLTGVHHDAGLLFLPDGRAVTVTVLTAGDYDASVQFQHDLAELLWHDLES